MKKTYRLQHELERFLVDLLNDVKPQYPGIEYAMPFVRLPDRTGVLVRLRNGAEFRLTCVQTKTPKKARVTRLRTRDGGKPL